ncbi:tyrosine-type recombinase/integrase [Chloroflexota bacterium]
MKTKSLGDFLFIYQQFAAAENKSPRTIEAVTASVGHFGNYLGGCEDPGKLRPDDLRRYIRSLLAKKRWQGHPTIKSGHGSLSPHSIASYVRSIRAFWSWLLREGFISLNPFEKIRPPQTPKHTVNVLTVKQVEDLLRVICRSSYTGYRDRALIIALFGTGLRISELLNVRMGDLNFDTGQIRVLGKGARERVVFMSASVFKVLIKYSLQWRPQDGSDFFFVNKQGCRLSRFDIAHRVRRYGQTAGIQGVRCSPHTLRSSFAVQYLRNGGDTFTLQRILGHSSLEMTRHYAEVSSSDVEAKLKAHSPAENLRIKV